VLVGAGGVCLWAGLGVSFSGLGLGVGKGEFARFVFQHHRDAITHWEGEAIDPADQFLTLPVMPQRAFANRTDENF